MMLSRCAKFLCVNVFVMLDAYANFEHEWSKIQNTDKSYLTQDIKSRAGSQNSNALGVENDEVNDFVKSTPTDQHSLESNGMNEYFSGKSDSVAILRDAHSMSDENNPEVQKYLKKADEVVSDTNKILKRGLLDYIKSETGVDINCVPIDGKSHLRDDPYVIGLDTERVGDEIFEPFYCEKLFNTYDCLDTLYLTCKKFSSRPESIVVTYANFNYKVDDKGIMTMRHDYKINQGGYSQTGSGFFTGGSLFGKSKEKFHELASANLELHFNVNLDQPVYHEFALLDVYYTGMVLITLNDNVVFSNPNNLKSAKDTGRHDRIHTSTKGNILKKIKYYDHYPVIETNLDSKFRLGYDGCKSSGSVASVDVRKYLRKNDNKLVLIGFAADSGYVQMRMRSHERLCLEWYDEWRETCILRKY